MANSIALIKKYTTLLDEVYKESAKTVALESNSELTRAGANTNEIIIPRITMQGLAGSGATISVNQLNLHIDRLAAIQLHFKLPA
jgi:hypothetical protein